MLRTATAALLVSLAAAPLCASTGSSRSIDSSIERVTVYRSGALIERVAQVAVSTGDNPLLLPGLPAGLDLAQVQLSVAQPGLRLGQLRQSREERLTAVNEEVERLQAALQKLGDEERAVADAVRTAELKLKFLDGLAAGYAKQSWFEVAQGGGDTSAWTEALATLDSGATDALARIRASEGEKIRLAEQRSQLERQLKQLRGRAKATTTLALTLTAAKAQTVDLRIRYPQAAARWQSSYEARVNSETGTVELQQQAAVTQTTGESWDNVSLSLSTGNPSEQIAPPGLGPEFLNLYDPTAVRMKMQREAARPAQFDSAVAGMQNLVAESSIEEVVLTVAPDVSQFGVTYPVPGRVSVANNASDAQRFDLERLSFDAELVTRVVPSRSAAGYLLARFTYDQEAPLAASRLRAFLDGNYVGESQLPRARQGAKLELPLGRNRRLEVVVEDQGGEDGESGLISKRREEAVDWLYKLTNRGDRPTMVEVLDRIPVAENEDITVTVPRSATRPTEKDLEDQPGVVLWKQTMKNGEDWRIRHQYTVSYPADQRLRRR